MEYLYKALRRDVGVAETGVAEAEPSCVALIEEQRSEPVAAARIMDTVAPAPAGVGKAVPFP